MISRRVLDDLPISIPNLETQKRMVEASRLAKQAYAIESRLADLRYHHTHLMLTGAVAAAHTSKGAPL